MNINIAREKALAELCQYRGAPGFQAFLRYLEAEAKTSTERLVKAEDEKESDKCRGEIRMIRRVVSEIDRHQPDEK